MKKLLLFLCLAGMAGQGTLRAQSVAEPDVQAAIDRYSQGYLTTIRSDAAIFNGKIQAPMPDNRPSHYLRDRGFVERDEYGHEIFPQLVPTNETFAVGDLWYDGVKYCGITMRLDLFRDELMVQVAEGSPHTAVLDPLRLGYADLRGYRIIYIPERSPRFNLPEGYYLRLREGRHDMLRKERFLFSLSKMEFIDRSLRFYVEKDGVYHPVNPNKRSLMRVLRDRRRELERFVRENRIDVKRDTESSLVRIVEEYERLTGESAL